MKLSTFKIGGIHPEENKLTAEVATQVAPLPKQAVFPLSQHIGAPAKPVVGKGDRVKVGTLLAEAGGFVSAPIYSSVSGTVVKIDTIVDATDYRKPAIFIKVEGDEWEEGIDRSDQLETLDAHPELTPEEIVERVKQAGITGMGGAGFPTHVKLCPPPTAKAECVIINAVECEPYITSDYRLMMEHADEIVVGLQLLMKAAKVERGYIGIEENKPKAIDLLAEKTSGLAGIEVVPLKMKYPQGGETGACPARHSSERGSHRAERGNGIRGLSGRDEAQTAVRALHNRQRKGTEKSCQLPRAHGNAHEPAHRPLRRHARRRQQGVGRRTDDGARAHDHRGAHL